MSDMFTFPSALPDSVRFYTACSAPAVRREATTQWSSRIRGSTFHSRRGRAAGPTTWDFRWIRRGAEALREQVSKAGSLRSTRPGVVLLRQIGQILIEDPQESPGDFHTLAALHLRLKNKTQREKSACCVPRRNRIQRGLLQLNLREAVPVMISVSYRSWFSRVLANSSRISSCR